MKTETSVTIFQPINMVAWLPVPYLLWVAYATLLNIGIYIFNK